MLEEITVINGQRVHEILVKYLKRKKCAEFVPNFLMLDQNHRCSASSVEFIEIIDDDDDDL
jgi:hypothetical protein